LSSIRQQFYRGLFGLQFRTTILLTAVVLVATGLTGVTYVRMSAQVVLDAAKSHARSLAEALAVAGAGPVEAEDRDALLATAEQMVAEHDLTYVLFTDVSGRLLASYQRGAGNVTHLMLEDEGKISVEPLNQPMLASGGPGGPSVDVVYPVAAPAFLSRHGPRPTVGFVRLGVSLNDSQARLDNLNRGVFGLAVGIALLMVPLGYEVVRHLVGPIERLSRAARAFASGELETRVEIDRRDEIGELGRAFNGMADQLARSHNQLVRLNAELEDRVLQRTTDLEEANQQLREMASRDSLTGLYNRRHFNDMLSHYFAEARRYNTDLTCMMIDLDNFKRVNDTMGHQTGDELLRLTADIIHSSIRQSDLAVRYGGDEFAVLLPQTSPTDARASAERILSRFRVELAEKLPEAGIASLSIGLVSRDQDRPDSAVELVNLADEALYLAKAGGKNRITVARPTLAA